MNKICQIIVIIFLNIQTTIPFVNMKNTYILNFNFLNNIFDDIIIYSQLCYTFLGIMQYYRQL